MAYYVKWSGNVGGNGGDGDLGSGVAVGGTAGTAGAALSDGSVPGSLAGPARTSSAARPAGPSCGRTGSPFVLPRRALRRWLHRFLPRPRIPADRSTAGSATTEYQNVSRGSVPSR